MGLFLYRSSQPTELPASYAPFIALGTMKKMILLKQTPWLAVQLGGTLGKNLYCTRVQNDFRPQKKT